MAELRFEKIVGVPQAPLTANTIYVCRVGAGFDLYVTNESGTIVAYSLNQSGGGGTAPTLVQLSANAVNNNAVANTLQDTGLEWSVTAGKLYHFRVYGIYNSAATTNGARFVLDGPAATMAYRSLYNSNLSSFQTNGALTGYNLPTTTTAGSAASSNELMMEGILAPTSNGTAKIRFSSETASLAITLLAGSYVIAWEV